MIYDINYFIEERNNVDYKNIDINLKNKITELFSSYNCFSEENNNYNINSKYYTNKYSTNKYSNNKYSNRYSGKKYKHKLNKNKKTTEYYSENTNYTKKNRTDVEIIVSYLNKITKKNYEDLSSKICDNISDDNYVRIIDKLFEISYKQTSYSELYIELYKKILLSSNENELINKIIYHITSKINNIIENKNNELSLINEHIDKVQLDYSDFCDINKNAKHLKGKISIISNLIKNEIINLDKDILIDNLFKYENYNNEIFLEILQILNNILKLDNNKINVLQEYVNNTNFKGKMMLKFKLKDIIDNKSIKSF